MICGGECCEEMVKRGTLGVEIGELTGGEEKASYCKVVDTCTGLLPEGKPRYVIGVVCIIYLNYIIQHYIAPHSTHRLIPSLTLT